jgi:hypothetical protein
MSKILTVCFFGTTSGLERRDENIIGEGNVTSKIDNQWIEPPLVGTTFISPCIYVKRERRNDKLVTWFGYYSPAKEIGYTRDGGYSGAGVFLSGIKIQPDLLMTFLEKFFKANIDRVSEDNVFKKRLSELNNLDIPAEIEQIKFSKVNDVENKFDLQGKRAILVADLIQCNEYIDMIQSETILSPYSSILIYNRAFADRLPNASSIYRSTSQFLIEAHRLYRINSDMLRSDIQTDHAKQVSKFKREIKELEEKNITLKTKSASSSKIKNDIKKPFFTSLNKVDMGSSATIPLYLMLIILLVILALLLRPEICEYINQHLINPEIHSNK